MDSKVSDEAKRAATKCSRGQACLKTKGANACKVLRCVNGTKHFISNSSSPSCPYNTAFGCYQTCTCPVRQELYNKHRI